MKRSVLSLLVVLGIFSLACGLLDSEVATVSYEEGIPFDFEMDANELCSGEIEGDIDCSEDAQPAPDDIYLDPVEFSVDIDIVEATGNDNLTDVTDRLRSLEITSIDYEITDNDLTFDLPDVDIFVAPPGTEDSDAGESILLTTIPSVDAGTDVSPSQRANVEDDNRQEASELFKDMKYATIPRAQPVVREGQDFPPSGDAEIELTINIRITANPTDDL